MHQRHDCVNGVACRSRRPLLRCGLAPGFLRDVTACDIGLAGGTPSEEERQAEQGPCQKERTHLSAAAAPLDISGTASPGQITEASSCHTMVSRARSKLSSLLSLQTASAKVCCVSEEWPEHTQQALAACSPAGAGAAALESLSNAAGKGQGCCAGGCSDDMLPGGPCRMQPCPRSGLGATACQRGCATNVKWQSTSCKCTCRGQAIGAEPYQPPADS